MFSFRGEPGREAIEGVKGMAPILIGVLPFALVAGASAVDAGFSPAGSSALSLVVFAGAAQLAANHLIGEGSPILVIIGTALIINLRFIMYSASLAPRLNGPRGFRLLMSYMLTDQGYAVTMMRGAQPGASTDQTWYYFGASVIMWMTWQIGTVMGAVLGKVIPASWSLDFAVPLCFMAILVPNLRSRPSLAAGLTAGVASAFLVPILPLQTGLLVSILMGIAAGTTVAMRQGRRTGEKGGGHGR